MILGIGKLGSVLSMKRYLDIRVSSPTHDLSRAYYQNPFNMLVSTLEKCLDLKFIHHTSYSREAQLG